MTLTRPLYNSDDLLSSLHPSLSVSNLQENSLEKLQITTEESIANSENTAKVKKIKKNPLSEEDSLNISSFLKLSLPKDDVSENLLLITNTQNKRQEKISATLQRTVVPVGNKEFTGNTYIDGILWGGDYWNPGTSSTTTIITYSFWNAGTESFDDAFQNITTQAFNWSSAERTSMINALNTWAAVANIQFVDAGDNQESATLGFYNVNSSQFDALGMFGPPGTNGGGIGYFNWQGQGWDTNNVMPGGNYGFITLIHELGHGLGLAHPHDNGGGSSIYPGVTSPFGSLGDFGLNQGIYTTMSYNDGLASSGFDPGTVAYGYQGTPMAFDIAAIQYLYGANTTSNSGNNTYFLPTVNQAGTMYSSLWDTGGIDKISANGATSAVTINLNDATLNIADGAGAGGYLSSINGIFGGFTIANGVRIENADGGNFNDTITGNEFNNSLNGFSGNDILQGGSGNDSLTGGVGNDFAVYVGTFSQYQVTGSNGVYTITDLLSNRDGIDSLFDIENLTFSDLTILITDAVNPTTTNLAIAPTNANQTEGNSGTKAFTFTVTRSGTTTGANNVNWAVTGSGTNPASATDFAGGVLP
ncbi:M10 family metallopeptidase, partial [Geminocystis sp. GBBB08]|uniref:M10 family metallopeptidase n=1 Tax=Geminocystis sp. GBBB08 TaxID=2604140 RepID=UPI0027E29903